MFGFVVKGFAVTASFRIPESHTFQQTLPLPPITTMTGLMGAAVGLDLASAAAFRKENGILFGVLGTSEGEMKDLWKYNKMKASYKPDGSDRKDVLVREYLTDFSLTLAVASENEATLSKTRDCFCNPKYALTLGNSDDLVKIKYVSPAMSAKEHQASVFENTILAGNHTLEYESAIDLKNTPITYRVRAPQVFLLPTAFSFDGEERRVKERRQFTFVGSPIKLKNPVVAYTIQDIEFALL